MGFDTIEINLVANFFSTLPYNIACFPTDFTSIQHFRHKKLAGSYWFSQINSKNRLSVERRKLSLLTSVKTNKIQSLDTKSNNNGMMMMNPKVATPRNGLT